MTEIRHIVFDIGKVLIHYDPDLPFSRLIPDVGERRWFFDNVCTHDWNIEQDRGRTWDEAERLLIALHPEHSENIRNFRRHWHEMVPHAYEDSVALMLELLEAGRDVTIHVEFHPPLTHSSRAVTNAVTGRAPGSPASRRKTACARFTPSNSD